MGRKSQRKLYQFVDALVDIGARELTTTLKVDEQPAREVMRAVARGLCFRYAKSIMYVPADLEFELSKRDDEIWRKYGEDGPDGARRFTPSRIAQLGEEYRLSVAHLYCIVKLVQRRESAARQGTLFEAEVGETSGS